MKRHSLIWTTRAFNDLRQIKAFISYDKPDAAVKFLKQVKKESEHLRRFPDSGRVVPELGRSEIRELVIGNYRIIYKVMIKSVSILTVFEAHRRFRP